MEAASWAALLVLLLLLLVLVLVVLPLPYCQVRISKSSIAPAFTATFTWPGTFVMLGPR